MTAWKTFAPAVVLCLAWVACAGSGDDDDDDAVGDDDSGFDLTSTAFADDGTIPANHTCDNAEYEAGLSPPLAWVNAPVGTAAFAVTAIDIDAADTPHWGLIDIGATASALAEGIGPVASPPPSAWQTLNYQGGLGYAGPCPPRADDPHRYVFTLWALDSAVGAPVIEKELAEILPELEARALDMATLTGYYDRPE
jgi:Raf kinase inhibitor-like YbhB/YbcL family protein